MCLNAMVSATIWRNIYTCQNPSFCSYASVLHYFTLRILPENDLDKIGTKRPDNNESDGSTKPYTLNKREQRRVYKDLYQGCVGEKNG